MSSSTGHIAPRVRLSPAASLTLTTLSRENHPLPHLFLAAPDIERQHAISPNPPPLRAVCSQSSASACRPFLQTHPPHTRTEGIDTTQWLPLNREGAPPGHPSRPTAGDATVRSEFRLCLS